MQHSSQVFWVGQNLRSVIKQQSLTLDVFVLHAHFVHFHDFETNFLREVGLDRIMEIIHVQVSPRQFMKEGLRLKGEGFRSASKGERRLQRGGEGFGRERAGWGAPSTFDFDPLLPLTRPAPDGTVSFPLGAFSWSLGGVREVSGGPGVSFSVAILAQTILAQAISLTFLCVFDGSRGRARLFCVMLFNPGCPRKDGNWKTTFPGQC